MRLSAVRPAVTRRLVYRAPMMSRRRLIPIAVAVIVALAVATVVIVKVTRSVA